MFSKKVRAGKRRTYFFDVRRSKGDDFYIVLTENTKKFEREGGIERHKIFLYKEDFNRFMASLEEAVQYVKTELMPDYDYDEFSRRHEEYDDDDDQPRFDRPQYRDRDPSDGPPRGYRNDGPPRGYRDDGPPRSYRDDRPPRDNYRDDRPPRDSRDDRPPRDNYRDDRPPRDHRDDNPPKDVPPPTRREYPKMDDEDLSW